MGAAAAAGLSACVMPRGECANDELTSTLRRPRRYGPAGRVGETGRRGPPGRRLVAARGVSPPTAWGSPPAAFGLVASCAGRPWSVPPRGGWVGRAGGGGESSPPPPAQQRRTTETRATP